jgi:hypothetical protein
MKASSQWEQLGLLSEAELEAFEPLADLPLAIRRRVWTHAQTSLPKVAEAVTAVVGDSQILYLPTYRRIEKDLRTVIPELEEYLRRFHDPRGRVVAARSGRHTDVYVELVEFGMEDVQNKISEMLAKVGGNARREFGSLAGSYLRDIIRGQGRTYDHQEVLKLTNESVTDILRRVEENTLAEKDKQLLRDKIEEIKSTEGTVSDENAYIAHFFSKLVTSVASLKVREEPVARFMAVCNRYLEGKKIAYDDRKYDLSVIGPSGRKLELASLSSGEKQIISLFSHLFLSGDKKYIILIDEPELSLSVPWQQALLPDILHSGHCAFLGAVTHSPFIFDNELDKYAKDLRDCVSGEA